MAKKEFKKVKTKKGVESRLNFTTLAVSLLICIQTVAQVDSYAIKFNEDSIIYQDAESIEQKDVSEDVKKILNQIEKQELNLSMTSIGQVNTNLLPDDTWTGRVVGSNAVIGDSYYNLSDIRKPTKFSAEELDKIIEKMDATGGVYHPFKGNGKEFKEIEAKYKVNAIVLLSISRIESGWGTVGKKHFVTQNKCPQISKKNLMSMRAYDKCPCDCAKSYNTYIEGIEDAARHLSANYLTPSGPYFYGYSLEAVNKKYSSSKTWATQVTSTLYAIGNPNGKYFPK